ncbi:MAG: DUF4032 domain-containing protein [Chloroflexota bacterium]
MRIRSPFSIYLRPDNPDFLDLPWEKSLTEWHLCSSRVEELPRGVSRHSVVFVNYDNNLFAMKELPEGVAEKEYDMLREMEEKHLPTVKPVGHAIIQNASRQTSVLITHYLEHSLPYRSLFIHREMRRYQEHLLDAIAGLLVQLHLGGVFWGDCSLSNTLFRRDAGALQAYMVDAETTELQDDLTPMIRMDDLKIMEENITGELADLAASRLLPANFPVFETSSSVRKRYIRLWERITSEVVLRPTEHYRMQEHVRALNELGFSVEEVELRATENGAKLRLKAFVSDRNFHRDQLHGLTGIEAEEMQARQIINEIQELKASLSHESGHNITLSVAAYYWLEKVYQTTLEQLKPVIDKNLLEPIELYCQILEHKWFLSEETKGDVGHQAAVLDYLRKFYPELIKRNELMKL